MHQYFYYCSRVCRLKVVFYFHRNEICQAMEVASDIKMIFEPRLACHMVEKLISEGHSMQEWKTMMCDRGLSEQWLNTFMFFSYVKNGFPLHAKQLVQVCMYVCSKFDYNMFLLSWRTNNLQTAAATELWFAEHGEAALELQAWPVYSAGMCFKFLYKSLRAYKPQHYRQKCARILSCIFPPTAHESRLLMPNFVISATPFSGL